MPAAVGSNVTAVVFDWGGVIQRTIDPGPRRALDQELGLPPGGVDEAVFGCPIWQDASLGRVSADAAWEEIASSVGVRQEEIDQFVERFFAGDHVDDVLVSLIRELRASGIPVALLSNAPPGRTSGSAAGRWGMEVLFDTQVFSYEVGALKPDPRMYQAVISALARPAGEILFVDDSATNVDGAKKAGMQAIHYVGNAELLVALAELGIVNRRDTRPRSARN